LRDLFNLRSDQNSKLLMKKKLCTLIDKMHCKSKETLF